MQARLEQGLATRPELLLASRTERAPPTSVQEAMGFIANAQAALAESIGIPPTLRLRTVELSALPLPGDLGDAVEGIIDRALVRRPDLAARLAALRAREAEVKRARAEFMPRGGALERRRRRHRTIHLRREGPAFDYAQLNWGAFLNFEWTLFDGFERENRVRETVSQRGAAEAEASALELGIMRQVWQAYADMKTALAEARLRPGAPRCRRGGLRVDLRVLSVGRPGHRARPARRPARPGPRPQHRGGRAARIC